MTTEKVSTGPAGSISSRLRRAYAPLGAAAVLATAACAPTIATARIDDGSHLSTSVTVLPNAAASAGEHGLPPDFLVTVSPMQAINHKVELGAPMGAYVENRWRSDLQSRETIVLPVILPYLKYLVTPPTSPTHLAVIGQTYLFVPAGIGFLAGQQIGSWEPGAGVTWSRAGSFGPVVVDETDRFLRSGQRLMVVSGSLMRVSGSTRPVLLAGMLRNSYLAESSPAHRVIEHTLMIGARLDVQVRDWPMRPRQPRRLPPRGS